MTPISKHAKRYQRFAERRRNAHQMLVNKSRHRHTLLCLFMSFIVGVTVFATIYESTTSVQVRWTTGFLSVIALTLSSCLSFVRFHEIEQQHKSAAAAYEANRLNLDVFSLANVDFETVVPQQALSELKRIAKELKKISQTAPRVPDTIWDSMEASVKPA